MVLGHGASVSYRNTPWTTTPFRTRSTSTFTSKRISDDFVGIRLSCNIHGVRVVNLRRGSVAGVWGLVLPILLLALGASCAQQPPLARQLVAPGEATRINPRKSPVLKAHLKDGRVFVFSRWVVNEQARVVTGFGQVLDIARRAGPSGTLDVPLDAVALFETNEPIRSSDALAGMTVVTGASLVVTGLCLANPKSCFGSCPTFYVSDGERPVLQAEGFSDSIAPTLEATDIDSLFRARPTSRTLTVRMTNEALETHVVKDVEVLTVARPPGTRVFYAGGDGFYVATGLHSPDRCMANEGPCTEAVRAFDGQERFSLADGRNLAAREEVTLQFDTPGAGRAGLVLAVRQTLMTTFLLYQALAYLGTEATAALSELERDPSLRTRVEETHHVLGGIEVETRSGTGAWQRVGEVFETGPIATDVHLVLLPSSWSTSGGPVQVRLKMARGNWRIDWVALANLGARTPPSYLRAQTIVGETDAGRKVTVQPGQTMVTLPGDRYDLTFELPEHPDQYELFLSSRGYYLEWIRQQWLEDESRARAAMMLYTPSLALRVLAPDYKRQEAGMERLFWGSRYARP